MAASSGDWLQAVNLLQQALSLSRKTGDLTRERDALIALAQTERERNNLNAARDYHEKALELTESIRAKVLRQELRASFLASQQDEYELYTDLLMRLHQQQPDAGYAAHEGVRPLPSQRRRFRVPPARIGSISQATRVAQAVRDARAS